MPDYAIFWEWLSLRRALAARDHGHRVDRLAFYFIALDLGLRKTPSLPPLAHGEEWQVHGGGFYHIQKYLVAPEFLPEHLTWFKWESYFTWISGFMLLVDRLLFRRRPLPHRPPRARRAELGRDPHLARLDRPRLGGLRHALQVADRQFDHRADGRAVRDPHRDGLGLHAGLHRPRGDAAHGRLHRDDHGGQRRDDHHPQPEDRRRRPQGGPGARRQVRQDRQAALAPQQLPDAARHLLHAVEPLPAGLRDAVELAHRRR